MVSHRKYFIRRWIRLFASSCSCSLAIVSASGNPPDHASALALRDIAGDRTARTELADQLRAAAAERRASAVARAAREGWTVRQVTAGGRVRELVDVVDDVPLFFETHNANAALSINVTPLRGAPWQLSGEGLAVGVWDGGIARASHREFGGRIEAVDNVAADGHATHVTGTLAASGVTTSVRGMAPAVRVLAYDWNSDLGEMTAAGAGYPAESGRIHVSNHSYGYTLGWGSTGGSQPAWEWFGSGTSATGYEARFGQYNNFARDRDALAHSLPYYLIVQSAGNDRSDNPVAGAQVALRPGSTSFVSYDPELHPPGDARAASGYDTLSFNAVAKNLLTVGAVNDAVNFTARSLTLATMTNFSAWGPTDDGRIKPDLVTNGASVYSTQSGSDSAYGTMSGTSMAAPSASGAVVLLQELFMRLFPGHALRAATAKGLLLHTADDLGPPGPDYQFGWGLLNAARAAQLLQRFAAEPGAFSLHEDRLTSSAPVWSGSLLSDGSSPLRVTLCWTDPAGPAALVTAHNNRTRRLVNDLNLVLIDPQGVTHFPWVMPWVGAWRPELLDAPATTGINSVDNIEQVFVAAPSAGRWQVRVSHAGTLSGGAQHFSLLADGALDDPLPAPSITSVAPATSSGGRMTVQVAGPRFMVGTRLFLERPGFIPVPLFGIESLGNVLRARLDADSLAAGLWDVVALQADGQRAVLSAGFAVTAALWQEGFEDTTAGWQSVSISGTNRWAVSSAAKYAGQFAMGAPVPRSASVTALVSPPFSIPESVSNLKLSFWHSYGFDSRRGDGGVLELSQDGGATWYDVTGSGSGVSFSANGYTAQLAQTLNSRWAWTGSSSGWRQSVVDFNDIERYAGSTLRLRWLLATNSQFAGTNWFIDEVTLAAASTANQPPVLLAPVAAEPALVSQFATRLSVLADDDGGSDNLSYTWMVNDTFADPVQFSVNGSADAASTVATFTAPGDYLFSVMVRDAEGLTTTGSVEVTVVGETFAGWQRASFSPEDIAAGLAEPAADPDGDGIANILEYALGTDPLLADNTPWLAVHFEAETPDSLPLPTVRWLRPRPLADLWWVLESSPDLVRWLPLASDGGSPTPQAADLLPLSEDLLLPADAAFIRLRAGLQPISAPAALFTPF
jgi:hypothetical protein